MRVTDECPGEDQINGVNGMSDIEGKASREVASEFQLSRRRLEGLRQSSCWEGSEMDQSPKGEQMEFANKLMAMMSGSSAGRAWVAPASFTAGGTET